MTKELDSSAEIARAREILLLLECIIYYIGIRNKNLWQAGNGFSRAGFFIFCPYVLKHSR
ncbi:MAG: hypothetical protein CMF59_00215 [Leptospiraceae bacterium]|nr:hypothetical protein [Leptospiraceae bacterium]